MNSPQDENTASPSRGKWVLLILFLLVCVAGLAFAALVIWGPSDGVCQELYSKAASSISKFTKSKEMFAKVGSGEAITCRGVTLDVNNNALAIMGDQTVGIGQTFKGIKIIDITSGYVMIEYQGQTRRLELGEKLILQ